MRYLVTSVIPGIGEADCGELYCEARGGRESVTFRYSAEWLSHGYDLSPDVPVGPGTFYSSEGFSDLRAFSDAMPDRWGRNLLKRDEARRAKGEGLTPRTLLESDFLVGVADVSRQGSIRIWDESGNPLDATMDAVPRVVELPALLDAADRAAEDLDADVRDLVAAGSSLGGARPKATVIDVDGSLCVCKLPKAGETEDADVCAWEHVVLELSRNAGIEVPKARLLRLGSRSALLTERFDRVGDERVPYISGMSAIEGSDGGAYSLDMLVDFVETYCEDPDRDCVRAVAQGPYDLPRRQHGQPHEELRLPHGRGWLAPLSSVRCQSHSRDKGHATRIRPRQGRVLRRPRTVPRAARVLQGLRQGGQKVMRRHAGLACPMEKSREGRRPHRAVYRQDGGMLRSWHRMAGGTNRALCQRGRLHETLGAPVVPGHPVSNLVACA